MYYGYDQDTPLWKEDRKMKLHDELKSQLGLRSLGDVSLLPERPLWMIEDKKPYLIINSFGKSGVSIKRLTQLPKEQQQELVGKCEKIYLEVMMEDEDMN